CMDASIAAWRGVFMATLKRFSYYSHIFQLFLQSISSLYLYTSISLFLQGVFFTEKKAHLLVLFFTIRGHWSLSWTLQLLQLFVVLSFVHCLLSCIALWGVCMLVVVAIVAGLWLFGGCSVFFSFSFSLGCVSTVLLV